LTGSERAGAAVASEAKKSTMELGGSDAFIVLDDADLDTAVKWGVWGRMNNTGQCCVAAKRFILHEKIADVFLDRFKKELEKLVPGDPMDPKTTLGPLCTSGALELIEKQIKTGVDSRRKGVAGRKAAGPARVLFAANDPHQYHPGEPGLPPEFFAPVALIFRVKDEKEAINLANDSPYGLGGSITLKITLKIGLSK
jgi:succinate-semialdehyde dehydrogenase/glutarate-semialdehyde dehydrogenase